MIPFAHTCLKRQNNTTSQPCLNMPTCTYIDSDSGTTCWLIDHPLSSSKPSLPFLIHKSLHPRPQTSPYPIPLVSSLITPIPKRTRLTPNSQPPTCRLPSLYPWVEIQPLKTSARLNELWTSYPLLEGWDYTSRSLPNHPFSTCFWPSCLPLVLHHQWFFFEYHSDVFLHQ